MAAQSGLGSRWRSWRRTHPVGWLGRFSLTIRNSRHRYHLASRPQRANHLAAFGHAVGGIGAIVFGIAAFAVALRSIAGCSIALTLHGLHAIRHVHVGHCHVGVSGCAHRRRRSILVHSRNSRPARRKRQRDRDQDSKYGANDVQELRRLQATIMKPSRIRSRHNKFASQAAGVARTPGVDCNVKYMPNKLK